VAAGDLPESADVTLAFALPDGVAASVPWPQTATAAPTSCPAPTFQWATQAVLGRFTADRFSAAGTDFQVAIMDRPRAITDAGIRRWLTTAAETVAGLYGRFPTPSMQVVVVPYPGGGDPVYFGMALRGGGPAVLLLISGAAEDHEFPGEWVTIHEFLHHGMPFVQHDRRVDVGGVRHLLHRGPEAPAPACARSSPAWTRCSLDSRGAAGPAAA
jgi:hypothetical protein